VGATTAGLNVLEKKSRLLGIQPQGLVTTLTKLNRRQVKKKINA